ncbi:MAG: hypothetical protein KAI72_07625 [Candidatus Pacebacteria bacterium]|nr:hypothetical protein [Candidatus Paceibacterota bacterium]
MRSIKIIVFVCVILVTSYIIFTTYSSNPTIQEQQEEQNDGVTVIQEDQNNLEVAEELNLPNDSPCDGGLYVEEFSICGKEIGRSIEDRPIYVFEVGDGDIDILFVGGLHTGLEKNTYDLAKNVLEYYNDNLNLVPENISLHIIPVVNPDGLANDTHNNANGVDLNRNWATEDWQTDTYHPTYGTKKGAGGESPMSEPETKALYDFITTLQPEMTFVWHSRASTVEDNDIGDADELAGIYAQAADYEHIEEWTYYVVTGDFLPAMQEVGIAAAEVELASREQEFDRNIKGVEAILEYFE